MTYSEGMSRDICHPAKTQAEIFFCLFHDPTPSKGLAWLSSCPSLFSFILKKFSECPLRFDTWDAWMEGRERWSLRDFSETGRGLGDPAGISEGSAWLMVLKGWSSKMTMVGASFCGSGACQREPQSAPGNRMQTGRTAHMCFRNSEIASTFWVVV